MKLSNELEIELQNLLNKFKEHNVEFLFWVRTSKNESVLASLMKQEKTYKMFLQSLEEMTSAAYGAPDGQTIH